MKSTKGKSVYKMGDMPSSVKIFGKKFNLYVNILKQTLNEYELPFLEKNLKMILLKKTKLKNEGSARKVIRDLIYLGILGKTEDKYIFITDLGNEYNGNNNYIKEKIVNELTIPLMNTKIIFLWSNFLLKIKEELGEKYIIFAYLIDEKEFETLNTNELLSRIKELSTLVELEEDTLYRNRINRAKMLLNVIESDNHLLLSVRNIEARKFQSKFRNNLIKESKGISMLIAIKGYKYLIASHIIDFKDTKGTVDEYNKNNGLLLTPNIDKLFDKKIITFNDKGLILSYEENFELIKSFGLNSSMSLPKKYLTSERIYFLNRRNNMYFKKEKLKEISIYENIRNKIFDS